MEKTMAESKMNIRVAGIVLKWIRCDKALNMQRIEPMIRQAAERGADIVVTTECFLDGYAIADKSLDAETYSALGEPIPGGVYYEQLAGLAKELNIHLAVGLHEIDGGIHYNTAALIGPDGRLIGKYHKQRLGHETNHNTAGSQSLAFETFHGRLGMMICKDRGDRDLVQHFFDNGAGYVLCLSGGMFGPEKNDPVLQARSKENGAYIVFVHPCEFLVTGPDGAVRESVLLGNPMGKDQANVITEDQIGGERDQNRVCSFDLPLAVTTPRAAQGDLGPSDEVS